MIYFTIFARISVSRRILISRPSTSMSLPAYLPNRTSSPLTTLSVARSPLSRSLPGPVATTRPRCGFCFAVSGSRIPPAVFSSASSGSTTTRSSRGRIFRLVSFAMMKAPCELHAHATHATHTTHATHATHTTAVVVVVVVLLALLGNVRHQRFRGQEQAGHAGA